MLTQRECPEIGRGVDDGGRGVKAPEDWRSPRPGGLRGGIEYNEHPWGLRRRVSEADRAVVRMRRMPESEGDFSWQDAGDELLTPQDYPGFQWGKAEAVADNKVGLTRRPQPLCCIYVQYSSAGLGGRMGAEK